MTRTHLPERNLDVLRSIAVLCVVADHLSKILVARSEVGWALGAFGVDLFFVHTSLVLMSSLERLSLPGRSTLKTAGMFYARRAFRIYPLAMVTVFIIVLAKIPYFIAAHGEPYIPFVAPTVRETGANLLLVQNIVGARDLQGPLWSLPLEVQMYVLLPALFLVARRSLPGVVAVAVAATLLGMGEWYITGGSQPEVPFIWRLSVLKYAPCFMGGVLAYAILKHVRAAPRWAPGLFAPLLLASGLLFLGATHYEHASRGWVACTGLSSAIPFVREMAESKITALTHEVAKYSYGVYLLHIPVLWLAMVVCKSAPVVVQAALFIVGMVGLPILAYHLIEQPGIKLGQAITGGRGGGLAGAAPAP